MLRRSLLALALTLAAAGSGPLASPAAAFQIGMQDDNAFVAAPPFQQAVAFNRAQAMGVSYLRMSLVWASYQRVGFWPYDVAVNQARRHGMTVQLTVTGNPRFTAGGHGYIGRRPNVGRYATWIGRIARHFRGRVRYYSVWNEPNLNDYLFPQRQGRRWVGPLTYGRLVSAAYRAVKRNDPGAKVLIGEMAPSGHPLEFLARASQGGLRADGWAHHPYQFVAVPPDRRTRYTGAISRLGQMKRALGSLARRHKLRTPRGGPLPIYFTEFGYPRPGAYYGFFSEARRTRYALQAFRMAKRAGVRVMVWYQLYNHPGRTRHNLWDTGLMSLSGQASPLYRSFVSARPALAGR